MISCKLTAPPAVEPVTLDEVKAHLRLDTSSEDSMLSALIVAARQWAEKYTNRAFIKQIWLLAMDNGLDQRVYKGPSPKGEPPYVVELPKSPLISINTVTLYDEGNNAIDVSPDDYFVDLVHEPGRIFFRSGTIPLLIRRFSGLQISFNAGYGEAPQNIPEPIRLAIKQIAAHWYEHRGEAVIMSATRHDAVANVCGVNVPLLIQALLDPYRMRSLGGL